LQHVAKVPLADYDNMVNTLPSDRADQPFRTSVFAMASAARSVDLVCPSPGHAGLILRHRRDPDPERLESFDRAWWVTAAITAVELIPSFLLIRSKASAGARKSRGQLTPGELSQVISLAERDPIVPENVVSRCHVKIEVGQREPGQIFLGSQTYNTRGHIQLDLARIGVAESISLKFLDKL
jgi:hypothetical protein